MKLLPSLRQKKRYIVFEVISDNKFSVTDVYDSFQKSVKSHFGEMGMTKASPLFLKERFNEDKQRFVIKVNNKFVDDLKSALTLNKSIKNETVIIKSIITSGTLKKAGSYL